MSWKEVSEEMEKIEKIVGQMEEGTEEETDKKTKEKDKEKKKKERTEVAQIHMTDSANRKFFQKNSRVRHIIVKDDKTSFKDCKRTCNFVKKQ